MQSTFDMLAPACWAQKHPAGGSVKEGMADV